MNKDDFYVMDDIEQLKVALNNCPVFIYIKDTQSRYIYANKKTLNLFECTIDELIGRTDKDFFPADVAAYLRNIDERVLQGESTQEEIIVGELDGCEQVYLEVQTPIYDTQDKQRIVAMFGISTDISYQKKIENEVRSLALTDPLTNLPNRRYLIERIEEAQNRSQRQGTYCAVLFVDLDKFKLVNDIHGHDVGDQLLMEVAHRLKLQVRKTDTVARVGGDEYIVLLEGIGHDIQSAGNFAEEITERMSERLSEVYELSDVRLEITASIGFSLFYGEAHSTSHIISTADQEMYKRKHRQQP